MRFILWINKNCNINEPTNSMTLMMRLDDYLNNEDVDSFDGDGGEKIRMEIPMMAVILLQL